MPKKEDSPFVKGPVRFNVRSWVAQFAQKLTPDELGRIIVKSELWLINDGANEPVKINVQDKMNSEPALDRGRLLEWIQISRSMRALSWLSELQENDIKEGREELRKIHPGKAGKLLYDLFDALKFGAAFNAVIVQCKKDLQVPQLEILKQDPKDWPAILDEMTETIERLRRGTFEKQDTLDFFQTMKTPLTLDRITPGPVPGDWGNGYCFSENYNHSVLLVTATMMKRGSLYEETPEETRAGKSGV